VDGACSDSFPNQSTEIFILQMMLKNFLFYGFSTFINKWAAVDGAGFVFRTFGITSLCLLATSIPMCKCRLADGETITLTIETQTSSANRIAA
jgi:hypothetical protein